MKLEGQVALVTGGSRSIGRAIALTFAREGAAVAVNYVSHAEEAESAVREIERLGRRGLAVRADTSQRAQVQAMVDEVTTRLGPIDILVNNAGVQKRVFFLELDEADWDWMLGVNLKGCFLVGQAVAARMKARGRGKIINVSSEAAGFPAPRMTAYCVSKAGVAMLTKCMALELAPHGIRVNALAPGLTRTDINRKDLEDETFLKARLTRIPLGRVMAPEDLVGAVIFLASADSDMMTGMTLQVDGGRGIA
ncbi:MAG: 3-oxoacyl-ACP reductase FabG [candidate division NC10 bacterium]|nr:3-oxoacyl-ACP reductase FabG [candidate division NC10 bacterium]MBI2457578.1 3-oxoacyl-ACP reductase FabG [candidate division NC10 bacterium]MBI2560964.1 3-oxoacyl-ACP reductase FabG [candidate division NC10 bacterium]